MQPLSRLNGYKTSSDRTACLLSVPALTGGRENADALFFCFCIGIFIKTSLVASHVLGYNNVIQQKGIKMNVRR